MDGEGGSQQGAEPAQAQGAPPPGHTFLGGEVGPARRQAAQPVPADLHQALVGRLLQHGAALPPEGLPPPQAELALGRGSRWGAALLVPRKAAETKNRQLLTGSPSEWLTSPPLPTQIPATWTQPLEAAHFAFSPNQPQQPSEGCCPPIPPTPAPSSSPPGSQPQPWRIPEPRQAESAGEQPSTPTQCSTTTSCTSPGQMSPSLELGEKQSRQALYGGGVAPSLVTPSPHWLKQRPLSRKSEGREPEGSKTAPIWESRAQGQGQTAGRTSGVGLAGRTASVTTSDGRGRPSALATGSHHN